MAKTRLSTKGQLIIPKEVRDRHGWTAGMDLEVEDRDDHLVVRLADTWPEARLEELVGSAGYRGPARTLADMEAGIARGARAGEPPRTRR